MKSAKSKRFSWHSGWASQTGTLNLSDRNRRTVLGIHLCAHHRPLRAPFQYERSTATNIFSLARLFDYLVRVSRRVKIPHFRCQHWVSLERNQLAACTVLITWFQLISPIPGFWTCLPAGFWGLQDNPSQVVLTNEMEALSLSLSRLQVLFTLCPKCFSNFR